MRENSTLNQDTKMSTENTNQEIDESVLSKPKRKKTKSEKFGSVLFFLGIALLFGVMIVNKFLL